jgi:hypothetical protein
VPLLQCTCKYCVGYLRQQQSAAGPVQFTPYHTHHPCCLPLLLPPADAADDEAAAAAAGGGGGKALERGPVLLADADTRQLLTQQLKSGKDLIQTPFGNLPQISEKVRWLGSYIPGAYLGNSSGSGRQQLQLGKFTAVSCHA